jgi:hypothetical protein
MCRIGTGRLQLIPSHNVKTLHLIAHARWSGWQLLLIKTHHTSPGPVGVLALTPNGWHAPVVLECPRTGGNPSQLHAKGSGPRSLDQRLGSVGTAQPPPETESANFPALTFMIPTGLVVARNLNQLAGCCIRRKLESWVQHPSFRFLPLSDKGTEYVFEALFPIDEDSVGDRVHASRVVAMIESRLEATSVAVFEDVAGRKLSLRITTAALDYWSEIREAVRHLWGAMLSTGPNISTLIELARRYYFGRQATCAETGWLLRDRRPQVLLRFLVR